MTDYPVPWWGWALITLVALIAAAAFSLLAYVGRPPK